MDGEVIGGAIICLVFLLALMPNGYLVVAGFAYILYVCVRAILKLVFWIITWLLVKAAIGLGLWSPTQRSQKRRRRPAEEDIDLEELLGGRREAPPPPPPRPPRPPDPYEIALALLGLTAEFTQPGLKHAYRKAIVFAHPDNPAGTGSTKAAQAVNRAYEVIRQRHGWSR